MAADRGAYIDQSQSFNVHMSDPNFGKLTSLHFHTWRKVGGVHRSICCVVVRSS
jgi:ribonucleotide reductase alpha subunit